MTQRPEGRLANYRAYFMKGGRIVAPKDIEAESDAQAMLQAGELLSSSQFPSIEVWQEKRVVGALVADLHEAEMKASTRS
jgi:hypothetical protein